MVVVAMMCNMIYEDYSEYEKLDVSLKCKMHNFHSWKGELKQSQKSKKAKNYLTQAADSYQRPYLILSENATKQPEMFYNEDRCNFEIEVKSWSKRVTMQLLMK